MSRLVVPLAGTGDPLNNPSRVAPRNLFDLGFGLDNLLHTSRNRLRLHVRVINLSNADGADPRQWAQVVTQMQHDDVLRVRQTVSDTLMPGRAHDHLDQ